MANVSKELVLELQTIIKEDYDREVSFEQASSIGNTLVGYFDLLAEMHRQQQEAESPQTQEISAP
jgi:hypothetical protein